MQGGVHPSSGQGSWAQHLSPSWAWLQAVDWWSGGDCKLQGFPSLWQTVRAVPAAPGLQKGWQVGRKIPRQNRGEWGRGRAGGQVGVTSTQQRSKDLLSFLVAVVVVESLSRV